MHVHYQGAGAFANLTLRAGVDGFNLQKLMGHADLQVLRRYLT